MESLPNAAQRTVYLMTYSRADMAKFPSRETFSSAVIEAWNSCGIRVVQWVVCIEAHSNDCESIDEMNLYHFHMALNPLFLSYAYMHNLFRQKQIYAHIEKKGLEGGSFNANRDFKCLASDPSTDFTSFLGFARLFTLGNFELLLVWCFKNGRRGF